MNITIQDLRKLSLVFLVCLTARVTLYAQQADGTKIHDLFRKIADHYRNAGNLSFDVTYKYAAESDPGKWLDSMSGNFKMNNSSYWYMLDSTEAMGTRDYALILFREDRVMYLSRPTSQTQSANPLTQFDSLVLKDNRVKASLAEEGSQELVTLEFQPGLVYKRITYYIDRKTYFLTRMISMVRSDQLYEKSVRPMIKGTDSYVIVETDYNHYQRGGFTEGDLDTGRYFKKVGGDYTAVPPYDSYKILLASSNL
jgi:hypothetical protein